jgi:hypothetical protein
MNIKKVLAGISVLAFLTVGTTVQSSAQDAPAAKSEAPPSVQTPPHSYRLDYALMETEDGKKIDSRHYSMSVGGTNQGGRPSQGAVEVGTRVFGGAKTDGTNQYIDVSTRINGSLSLHDGVLMLDTYCNVTSVAAEEASVNGRPTLRTLTINNSTPVSENKATLVGTADDPNSKRTFELEVTVTEIK